MTNTTIVSKIYRFMTLALLSLLISVVATTAFSTDSRAIAGWNPGNIISDSVFTNKNSMSAQQIQTFLNSKVTNCDTWGVQTSEFGGGTRRQWAESRGYSAPFTCLKDYTENGKSAAQIIYDISQEYNLNPQVILVLLQKEQSLVTDTWPLSIQYRSATGYGCPDTAPCESRYFGLINQVRWSARMFNSISTGAPGWYTPYVLGNNFIRYSPDTSCGGSQVTIQNRATQALYNYTPYQPNQGALNAGWGSADCGAYGNRNFYLYFTNWFGSTQDNMPLISSAVSASTTRAGTGQPIYISYTVRNPNSYPIVVPVIGISNRLGGLFYDFNITNNVAFAANEIKTFSGVFFPGPSGDYKMSVTYNFASEWWAGSSTNISVEKPTLSLSKSLEVTPSGPIVNTPHTVSFTLKNTGLVEAHLTYVMAANMSGGNNFGYGAANGVILTPGQSYTYSASRTATSTEQQKSWASYMLPTGEWYGVGDEVNFRSYTSPARTEISKQLTVNPASPIINKEINVEFTIKNTGDQPKIYKNVGVAVERVSDGARFDLPSKSVTINGSSEYTYKASHTLPVKAQYRYIITGSVDGINWGSDVIGEQTPIEQKNKVVSVYNFPASLEITSPLTSMIKRQGELTTLTYRVKNTGDQPADSVSIAFYCRLNNAQYCDIPGDQATLAGGAEHTVTRTFSYNTPGTYTFKALRHQNGIWAEYGNTASLTVQPFTPNSTSFSTTLQLSQPTITLGQSITATYTLRNNTSVDLQIPRFAVAARLNGFHDFGFKEWFFIKAGETITFSAQFTPTVKGTYNLFPVTLLNDTWLGYSTKQLTVY